MNDENPPTVSMELISGMCTEAGIFAIRADRDYVVEEDMLKAVRKLAANKKWNLNSTIPRWNNSWVASENFVSRMYFRAACFSIYWQLLVIFLVPSALPCTGTLYYIMHYFLCVKEGIDSKCCPPTFILYGDYALSIQGQARACVRKGRLSIEICTYNTPRKYLTSTSTRFRCTIMA